MFGIKPPFRLVIGQFLLKGNPATAQEIYEALRSQYLGERQFTPNAIEDHVQALRAVGIVHVVRERLDEAEKLIQTYALSAYGKERVESFSS